MRWGSKILLAVGLVAMAVAVGFWLARIVVQEPGPMAESAPEMDTESVPMHTDVIPVKPDPPRSIASRGATHALQSAGQESATTAPASTNLISDWEARVDEVFGLDIEPTEAGKRLSAMLPQLPAEGRVEVLQHAVNLLSDEDYAPMADLLADPKTPEAEIEILMRDMLNRPDSLKLPLLLQVARTTGHVKAGEAREILDVFLGENYGEDWDKWQNKVNEYLRENPELSARNNP